MTSWAVTNPQIINTKIIAGMERQSLYIEQEIKTLYNHLKNYSGVYLFKNKNFNFWINCILDL
jgi:hypothetical protein